MLTAKCQGNEFQVGENVVTQTSRQMWLIYIPILIYADIIFIMCNIFQFWYFYGFWKKHDFLERKWWRLWQYLKLRSGGPHFGRSEADSKWKILSWMDQDLLYQVTPSSRYHTRVSTKQRSRSDPSLVKITCWNIRIQKRETNQWFQWNRADLIGIFTNKSMKFYYLDNFS